MFKHWEYEGGTSTPFIAYGPGIVKAGNQVNQPGHIIDLISTCLDLADVSYPKTYHQNKIAATEGVSLVPLFKGQTWKGHQALFFEHEGNKAVRQGDWKLVLNYPEKNWHLYNINLDRSELNDVSAGHPQKVKELDALYQAWTKHAQVLPFETLSKGKGE